MAHKQSVADIMTRDVKTLFEESSLLEVLSLLGTYRFRHLPVVDGKKLVGIVSHRDLLALVTEGAGQGIAAWAREARRLESLFLRDVMATQVVTIEPAASVSEAARRMLEWRIGALPVVDAEQELLGIVTENDLVRAFAHEL
jgi:CBS domain-containing protein